ncbi:penicillin-binding protein 2 [Verrucomicrobiota bacterium sgz303538]
MRFPCQVPIALSALAAVAVAQDASQPAARIAAVRSSVPELSDAPAPISNTPGSPAVGPMAAGPAPGDTGFAPTWETQKQARTYLLGIPAPRGQIVDRNGSPLAQTRVSYNLAITFPTPLRFSDREVLSFAQARVIEARRLTGRNNLSLQQDQVLKHYKNRGVVPLVIPLAQDLKPAEVENYNREKPANLVLQPVYQRFYPNGQLAGHVLGYAGRGGRMADGPIENNELLWPNAEGREGLEQTFDAQLQGKVGQYNISFDASGKKASEQISIPPQPGYNVVTTLDENIQRIAEQSLEKGTKRGAIVVIDPNNGDILALASWPTYNPNDFIPYISPEAFKALNEDKDLPLLPRAFRSAYPPGSTFKCFVGLAALQTHKIGPHDEFNCPPSYEVGNLTFRNWKKVNAGMLNFTEALTQSCNTWFYQVGLRIGAQPIIDYTQQLGLGQKTGIPLASEAEGRIPTDEYMLKAHKRKLMPGDVANLSIGQGDTLITPLQMAQAMAAIGNGGTLYQTRLVQQVQSIDGQIVTAYNVRAKGQISIDPDVLETLKQGMSQVVSSRMGTASRASVPNVQVAGKTGTAQWGSKDKERTAAWFAGFAPADEPKYAFAAVYEGEANNDDVHGGTQAAPLIGKVLRDLFKDAPKETAKKKKQKQKNDGADEEMVNDEDERPMRRSRPRQEIDEERVAPPPSLPPSRRPLPPPRQPFWRRIFG